MRVAERMAIGGALERVRTARTLERKGIPRGRVRFAAQAADQVQLQSRADPFAEHVVLDVRDEGCARRSHGREGPSPMRTIPWSVHSKATGARATRGAGGLWWRGPKGSCTEPFKFAFAVGQRGRGFRSMIVARPVAPGSRRTRARSSILRRVSFWPPSRALTGTNMRVGGFPVIPLKKLNGARFRPAFWRHRRDPGDGPGEDRADHPFIGLARAEKSLKIERAWLCFAVKWSKTLGYTGSGGAFRLPRVSRAS